MAILPNTSTCLELTMSIPGLPSSLSIPSSGEGGGVSMKDLDINQIPSGGEEECMEDEDESPNGFGGHPRKKLRLTKEQSRLLEESFRQNHTLNPKQKEVLAMQLRLKPRQVEVWFQNRRARSKLKQTEMECEYLKRWFGSLTEQNRRLQKEVEELRAMKVGPPTVLSPHNCEPLPASTLTMCPRCERVTATIAVQQDRAGPTTTTATGTTTSANPTLSAKVGFVRPRHPSAAC
ncbi:homeobox-leucine zipper protein HOX3-like [Coffea arabica]|uniref:Homeobox-leucine zipper protein HOX3-like n=1 Tax=Coffea arabica TaxID=13443 RepID=A0A6P6V5T2_COFAR|nr:homeobox-leucine zipper protein HOX3-like [Coffea arabica]XP_027100806.1 homeobox-leucine zipper protein HOX3-like [Coffea arabica]